MPEHPRGQDGEPEMSGHFERYLEALLSGGRPSPGDVATGDEAEMARTAAELAGATGSAEPDPAFLDQLRMRMRQADAGITAVRDAVPVRPGSVSRPVPTAGMHERQPATGRIRITRRALLAGGLGTAAGLAAGAAGMALLRSEPSAGGALLGGSGSVPLVGANGYWQAVVAVADLPEGSAVHFTTAAFDGYAVNDGGEIRALASVCTHMGCTLHYRPDWHDLRCPCHGASFDLAGRLANGPARWQASEAYAGDASAYPIDLPPLAQPRVKVADGTVYVWTAQV